MNTFGRFYRCTTFGESHGKALGVVIDGAPSGIPFCEDDIIPFLQRRRPGLSPLSTPRKEEDMPEILSGVFNGKTTGTPIAIIVRNTSQNSADYEPIKDLCRPGHADYTYDARYGHENRDWRGGGRSSGRETVARVLGGSLAAKILAEHGVTFESRIVSIHGETAPEKFESVILAAKENGDSVGGVAEVRVRGLPAGIGNPVFGKLDALLAAAVMSIGAVKGVEIGDGFAAADVFGSENNDCMRSDMRSDSSSPISTISSDSSSPVKFLSNHAGGILGGISNGNDIVIRFAVKPTPSISKAQETVDADGKNAEISVKGRHDPCIVPRILVVAECMTAMTILDSLMESSSAKF
ncbi:MAG: chorismate synthase [Methanomicrobium sp.]|nr:chorismate synthase [Methanomicrobium sp.]